MRTVHMLTDTSAKPLTHLVTEMCSGGMAYHRLVYPVGNASIDAIVGELREDDKFRDPLVASGTLKAVEYGKRVQLARYHMDLSDARFGLGSITEVLRFQ